MPVIHVLDSDLTMCESIPLKGGWKWPKTVLTDEE